MRPSKRAKGKGKGGGAAATWKPNVWIYFPTYHGERERFNGFCGARDSARCARDSVRSHGGRDRSPHVTAAAIITTTTHPAQRTRSARARASSPRVTATASAAVVTSARSGRKGAPSTWSARGRLLARSGPRCGRRGCRHALVCVSATQLGYLISAQGRLAGRSLSGLRVTAFYDDCWENRGRCQGMRPCQEPVDAAWSCRATAMVCPERRWADALAAAKVTVTCLPRDDHAMITRTLRRRGSPRAIPPPRCSTCTTARPPPSLTRPSARGRRTPSVTDRTRLSSDRR